MLYPYMFKHLAASRGYRAEKTAGVLACLILVFFMAARGRDVGVDTKFYCSVLSQYRNIPWKNVFTATLYSAESGPDIFSFTLEPGYRLINKVLSLFTGTQQAITIFNSILIIVLLYCLIKKESPLILLSLWLYVTLGIYQSEMNVTRNAIAILICYLAFRWGKSKNLLMYVGSVLLASTIHQTALLFIPIYWLVNYVRLSKKGIVFLMVFFAGLGLNLSTIGLLIKGYLPARYARYLSGGDFSLASMLVGVFTLILFFVVRYFMTTNEFDTALERLPIGKWMFALNICFYGLNLGMEAGARLAGLFWPYMICFFPQMIGMIESTERRKWAIRCVVWLSFVQFILRLQINNIGGTMPYHFFWTVS